MKTFIISFFFIINVVLAFSKETLIGIVLNRNHKPVIGVNIYIKNTFEGTITDTSGKFILNYNETDSLILVISCMGYKTEEMPINSIQSKPNFQITLKEDHMLIKEVAITAGSFEAGDEKRSATLNKLDIATGGGGFGDIYGAVRALPGATMSDDDGGLLVRGGERYETKTFIDGLRVESPYTAKLPDVPVRGRFSPFLFRGTVFSTGGYSVEYGQALSAAMVLNTIALPAKDETNISLFTTGFHLAKIKRWENTSLASMSQYGTMAPYYKLVKTNMKWESGPENFNQTLVFRQKTGDDGMLKIMGTCNLDNSSLLHYNTSTQEDDKIGMKNKNYFLITSYKNTIGSDWIIHAGLSVNRDIENIKINDDRMQNRILANEVKVALSRSFYEKIMIKIGSDLYVKNYNRDYDSYDYDSTFIWNFNSTNPSAFAETEIDFSKFIMVRFGVRYENISQTDENYVMPRFALAFKTSKLSQISLAYGLFVQQPQDDQFIFNSDLHTEKATHYIINYQIDRNSRLFRIEAYYKKYDDLVKFNSLYASNSSAYNNNGDGYAKGLDLFLRDDRSIRNGNYWLSYSYIDSKRNYRDYDRMLTPDFLSKHNLSLVYKHYFEPLNSFVSATYSFATGRPYIDPNKNNFEQQYTKNYHNLSVSWFYSNEIFNKFFSLYFQINNVFGFKNIYGYRYSDSPDMNGIYEEIPILPVSNRMIIAGIYISLQNRTEFN